jgi:hypothetical protein
MRSWTVRIKDGTLRTLTEAEFAERVREAADTLIGDQFHAGKGTEAGDSPGYCDLVVLDPHRETGPLCPSSPIHPGSVTSS